MKSKRSSVQNHPVIKRLVQFRSLLHQLENTGTKLEPEIDAILLKIDNNEPISREDFHVVIPAPRKKLRILTKAEEKPTETNGDVDEKSTKSIQEKNATNLTRDEQGALEFYKGIAKKKKNQKDDSEDDDGEDVEPNEETENAAVDEEVVGKRGINYQISKNKGLTPHRPKEQRNPRVKHRMKFRKATIRRKGAVREPRKEDKRYGGEVSGIKATVVRSVKLK